MSLTAEALDPVLDSDAVIQRDGPAVWEALSPLGRRAHQPANFLPLQSAAARGKPLNATVGQITDGHGHAIPLSPMAAALAGLDEAERSRAFLYGPVDGLPELRRAWRERQRRGQPSAVPSSLPIVTAGSAHARFLAAELFVTQGRTVVLPQPCPPEIRELFTQRLGARLADGLSDLPQGEPAVALRASPAPEIGPLLEIGERRPLVVLVDDTWEDLERPSRSIFWSLAGRHPNLIPIKIDGADGHLGFPGGRVGFLTFPFAPESAITLALESKVKMLLRAEVGSPSAAMQVILLRALQGAPELRAGLSARPCLP